MKLRSFVTLTLVALSTLVARATVSESVPHLANYDLWVQYEEVHHYYDDWNGYWDDYGSPIDALVLPGSWLYVPDTYDYQIVGRELYGDTWTNVYYLGTTYTTSFTVEMPH